MKCICTVFCLLTVSDVSDFIQFEIWDIPGQFKLSDIDAEATFSCTGTLIFVIDSQVVHYVALFHCLICTAYLYNGCLLWYHVVMTTW